MNKNLKQKLHSTALFTHLCVTEESGICVRKLQITDKSKVHPGSKQYKNTFSEGTRWMAVMHNYARFEPKLSADM